MKIFRIYQDLSEFLKPNKALIILGPRQVGKTTLMEDYLSKVTLKVKKVTGDDIMIHQTLGSQSLQTITAFCEGYDLIAIDEAQKIPGIGIAMKLMVDNIPGIKIIATGSSSFELTGQTGEPLTGRKTTLMLYSISQMEMSHHFNSYELSEKADDFLVFGSYPTVITASTIAVTKLGTATVSLEEIKSYPYEVYVR